MISTHLDSLRQKHQRLEKAIDSAMASRDDSSSRQLKKKKLYLKEEIDRLERQSG